MTKKFDRVLSDAELISATFRAEVEGVIGELRAVEQAVLQSPEIQGMRDALNQCRVALEPYDDVKPRDWKTDRENLRYAHRAVCAALAQEQGGSDEA